MSTKNPGQFRFPNSKTFISIGTAFSIFVTGQAIAREKPVIMKKNFPTYARELIELANTSFREVADSGVCSSKKPVLIFQREKGSNISVTQPELTKKEMKMGDTILIGHSHPIKLGPVKFAASIPPSVADLNTAGIEHKMYSEGGKRVVIFNSDVNGIWFLNPTEFANDKIEQELYKSIDEFMLSEFRITVDVGEKLKTSGKVSQERLLKLVSVYEQLRLVFPNFLEMIKKFDKTFDAETEFTEEQNFSKEKVEADTVKDNEVFKVLSQIKRYIALNFVFIGEDEIAQNLQKLGLHQNISQVRIYSEFMKDKARRYAELLKHLDEHVTLHIFTDRGEALAATLSQDSIDKVVTAYKMAGFSVSFTFKKDLDKLNICN